MTAHHQSLGERRQRQFHAAAAAGSQGTDRGVDQHKIKLISHLDTSATGSQIRRR